jgi:hypothetical protein
MQDGMKSRSDITATAAAMPSNQTGRRKSTTADIYLYSQGFLPSSILFKTKSSAFLKKVNQQN